MEKLESIVEYHNKDEKNLRNSDKIGKREH